MADSLSDADRIRNKRLAKLGGQNASSAAAQGSARGDASGTQIATPSPPAPKLQAEPKPSPQLENKQEEQRKPPAITVRPSADTPPRPASRSRPGPHERASSRDAGGEWEHRTLLGLFRITLDPHHTTDLNGNALYYAQSVAEELESEGRPKKLSVGSEQLSNSLEPAITEVASNLGKKKPLEYLLQCWKRVSRLTRTLKNGPPDNSKMHVLDEARRLCMSYSIFSVTIPEMFQLEENFGNEGPASSFMPYILAEPDSEASLDFEWLQDAVSRLEDEPELADKLVEAVEQMSADLATKSMNDDYRPYVQGLLRLLRFPALAAAVASSSNFVQADTQAQDIEKSTLLGPFFRLSPLQSEVAQNYFSAPKTRDRGYIANSQSALRMTLSQHQAALFDIVDRFVKNKESREKMLDWFALIVNTNHRRRAMQVDPRLVSSDGFMVNVTVCLDKLCEPFMDASFSKIDRIDISYLRRKPRINIADETKVNADQATSDKFYSTPAEGSNNFISEVFFLCAASHHYGTEAAQTKLGDMRKSLKRLDEQIVTFEAERSRYESGPPHILAVFEQRLKAAKEDIDRRHCVFHATEGVLLDEQLQARAMSFMRYVIVWIMRLVSGTDFPKQTLNLPLPQNQPEQFKCLPEYFLDDVVDHFKFITQFLPQVITPTQCEELVMLCLTFLESSEYIKNPGLKSGMVVILFHGVWPTRSSQSGVLGSLLNSMSFSHKHLLHALMKAFIECESTGMSSQFYDKFNTRYEIFQVVKSIWANTLYRDQLGREASQNVDFFVRFTNLLLNDATYLVDECFTSFHKITSLEKEVAQPTFASLPEDQRTEKEDLLSETKSKAKSYMPLVTETLSMLKLFTDALADSFTMPEVVQRLADMLDYNLDALVGPKKNTLRVGNKAEYNFHPATMLSDIADVYLNLGHKAAFHLAIARDGRSYRPANFAAAEELLRTKSNRAPEELVRWTKLSAKIEEAKAADEAEEEDLGEIPDEFLDPLLATLMTDPVILPTSRNVVDRSTIRQMLLSEERDPFNRAPLRLEDVLPDVELKGRVDAFRAEKRGRKTGADADAEADADADEEKAEEMDVSEG